MGNFKFTFSAVAVATLLSASAVDAAVIQSIWTGSASGTDPNQVLHSGTSIDASPFELTFTWDTANMTTSGSSGSGTGGAYGGDSGTAGTLSSVNLTVGAQILNFTPSTSGPSNLFEWLTYGYGYDTRYCLPNCIGESYNGYYVRSGVTVDGASGTLVGSFNWHKFSQGQAPQPLLLSGLLSAERVFNVLLTAIATSERMGSLALDNGLSLTLISDRVQRVLAADQGGGTGGGSNDVPLPGAVVLLLSGLSALGIAKGRRS